jgi:hypothetical protein
MKNKKQQYRLRNWREYNAALVKRDSLTFWFDEEIIQSWHPQGKRGRRGRPPIAQRFGLHVGTVQAIIQDFVTNPLSISSSGPLSPEARPRPNGRRSASEPRNSDAEGRLWGKSAHTSALRDTQSQNSPP